MAEFRLKTKNESNVKDKPRVYFTCHPSDFGVHFERICSDILGAQDCAIFYTEDMAEPLSEENITLDLNRMNLVVVPVTFRLLSTDNRAMTVDIPYAMEHSIPVLPLMMESGIVEIYSRPDRFGERQFITPDSHETTEIAYEKKLRDYLGSVLTSDEVAQRVRAAFDAYIFLSYRKKDRVHANELMKLIHENPKYRDIAIWYDEFLSPGESFRENITRALSDSKIFALLVTPSLLETPNFVMDEEYPAARENGKPILPVEMTETDKEELSQKYEQIPATVSAEDNDTLYSSLADMLVDIAIAENDDDPEHNYLIGLAYLHGIDVEVNREKGMELIKWAADNGYIDAMKMIADIYENQGDYDGNLTYRKKICQYYQSKEHPDYPNLIPACNNLAIAYGRAGEYDSCLDLSKQIYELMVSIYGDEHPDTLVVANTLAIGYSNAGDYATALTFFEMICEKRKRLFGQEHPDTLMAMINLSAAYEAVGRYEEMLAVIENAHAICLLVFGEDHAQTLFALNNLCSAYDNLGQHDKMLVAAKAAYEGRCKLLGKAHPDTLRSLTVLANAHDNLGDYSTMLALTKEAYELAVATLGEEHPTTLLITTNLATAYGKMGEFSATLRLLERTIPILRRTLGDGHPQTLAAIDRLAIFYRNQNNIQGSLEMAKLTYEIKSAKLGEEHNETLYALINLATAYHAAEVRKEAAQTYYKAYALACKLLGEEHQLTLFALHGYIIVQIEIGQYEYALGALEFEYPLFCKVHGESDPRTVEIARLIAAIKNALGKN